MRKSSRADGCGKAADVNHISVQCEGRTFAPRTIAPGHHPHGSRTTRHIRPLHLVVLCSGSISHVSPLATSWQQVVVMEFGKRHDTADTTNFSPHQLVTALLRTCRLCCGLATGSRQLVTDLLRGNWCNGF